MFDDVDLMRENLKAISKGDCLGLRVSQEHYTWLAGKHGMLCAIVEAAAGYVEGHPTSLVNIIQRVRDMREALDESVKLQGHYADLLNAYDGGSRIIFANGDDWMNRLAYVAEKPAQALLPPRPPHVPR
jgi:hypothetical protein